MPDLPKPVVESCQTLAQHLRAAHPGFYRGAADEAESWLREEVTNAVAADLGRVDTFRFEENALLHAALEALAEGQWDLAHELAEPRLARLSFWVTHEIQRNNAWQLIAGVAALGRAIVAAPAPGAAAGRADHWVERYVAAGAAVDRAHRLLEQDWAALLDTQIPAFEHLRAQLEAARARWRAWADGWARGFSAACRQHGFLPDAALQQRRLFDDVVRPWVAEGCTAYFVIDALRYEMALGLHAEIERTPSTIVRLGARLAELPTVTEVGMNALAPVAVGGRLAPCWAPKGYAASAPVSFRSRVPTPAGAP